MNERNGKRVAEKLLNFHHSFSAVLAATFFFVAQFAHAFSGDTQAIITNPLTATSLTGFIVGVVNVMLNIGSVIAVFFLIYAGFLYTTASGNEERIKKAHKTFLYTILGIALILGAKVLGAVICGTIAQIGTLSGQLDCGAFK